MRRGGASHTAQGMRLQTNTLVQAEERIHGHTCMYTEHVYTQALPLDLLLHPGTPLDLVPSPWKPLGRAGSDRLGGLRAGGLAWGGSADNRAAGGQPERKPNQPTRQANIQTHQRTSQLTNTRTNERTDGQTKNKINDAAALDGISKRNSGLL